MNRSTASGTCTALSGAIALVGLATTANAATCEDLVTAFAEERNLSAAPPVPAPQLGGTGASGEAPLARSGGVIAPPPTGDEAVIEPPETAVAPMPTTPEVEPAPERAPGDMALADAALQAQVEALLTAARAAANEGDEEQCMERLADAHALVEDRS